MHAMNPIVKVTVRGWKGRAPLSKFIMRWTFGYFSHVSLVFWSEDMEGEEWEARIGKKLIPHKPNSGWGEELTVPLTPEQMLEVHMIYKQYEGSSYDNRGLIGQLFHRAGFHDLNKWLCHEIVSYALLKVGYPLSRRPPFRENPSLVMENLRLT